MPTSTHPKERIFWLGLVGALILLLLLSIRVALKNRAEVTEISGQLSEAREETEQLRRALEREKQLEEKESPKQALIALEDAERKPKEEILRQLRIVLVREQKLKEAVEALTAEFAGAKLEFYRSGDYYYLKKKGLRDPEKEIVADLQKHDELIPHLGVAGGKMRFSGQGDIRILGRRWVLAKFEDGHITGKVLLEFSVSDEGKISWKVIDSYVQD